MILYAMFAHIVRRSFSVFPNKVNEMRITASVTASKMRIRRLIEWYIRLSRGFKWWKDSVFPHILIHT